MRLLRHSTYIALFIYAGLCDVNFVWQAARADAPADYGFTSYDAALKRAILENKPVFVYFGRYGCGFCAKVNQETFSDAKIKTMFHAHYALAYVDAESGNSITLPNGEHISEMEFGARLNVHATPVFLFLDTRGNVIVRAPGFKTIEEFIKLDTFVHEKIYTKMPLSDYLALPD